MFIEWQLLDITGTYAPIESISSDLWNVVPLGTTHTLTALHYKQVFGDVVALHD